MIYEKWAWYVIKHADTRLYINHDTSSHLKLPFVNSEGGKDVKSPSYECCRMQNRVHGFHHVSNNKLPQSNTARILIKTNSVTSSDIKAMVHCKCTIASHGLT